MPSVTAPVPTSTTTQLPVTAGVEIECNWSSALQGPCLSERRYALLDTIASELRAVGIPAVSYNEINNDLPRPAGIDLEQRYSYWNVGTDCSCGMELRSRIFHTQEEMEYDTRKVCEILAIYHITANSDCGLHVHLGTGVQPDSAVGKFHQYLVRHEDNLFRLVPSSRRNNRYCWPIAGSQALGYLFQAAAHPRNVWGSRFWFHQSSKNTTEIRIQRGSVDATVIFGWMNFLEQLWIASQNAKFDPTWKVIRVIERLPQRVCDGFATKKQAVDTARRMLAPGGKTPFLLAARQYLRKFNHAS